MMNMPLFSWSPSVAGAMSALALAIIALTVAGPAQARIFDPQAFTLDNGLQVVVVTDRRVPVVSHMVWYKVGAADEAPGHSGIAHLLEHLMFKGTPTVPQGEFSRLVSRNGGEENAFTSYDYTAYFQNIARDRLELVMRLEADRMRNLVLTEEQVAPEKQVVLEERRMRVDNDPAAVLEEETQATRYLNHPYRRPIIGWEQEIASLTAAEVLAFYRQWYAPNNAILVVTGDIDAAELRPLAEQTFGKVGRADVPQRLDLVEPGQRAERRLSLTDARVRQPGWNRSWRAPSYRYGAVQDAYPLQVLAQVLGGGATSRLYRQLVVERAMAVSADAWYDPSRRGPSELMISASPRPGVDLAHLEHAVEEIIGKIIESGFTDAEIERAKTRMVADAIFARDSYATAARLVGETLAIGQELDDLEAWPERIGAVTRAQVEAVARSVLRQSGVTSELVAAKGSAGQAAAAPPPMPMPSGGAIR